MGCMEFKENSRGRTFNISWWMWTFFSSFLLIFILAQYCALRRFISEKYLTNTEFLQLFVAGTHTMHVLIPAAWVWLISCWNTWISCKKKWKVVRNLANLVARRCAHRIGSSRNFEPKFGDLRCGCSAPRPHSFPNTLLYHTCCLSVGWFTWGSSILYHGSCSSWGSGRSGQQQ